MNHGYYLYTLFMFLEAIDQSPFSVIFSKMLGYCIICLENVYSYGLVFSTFKNGLLTSRYQPSERSSKFSTSNHRQGLSPPSANKSSSSPAIKTFQVMDSFYKIFFSREDYCQKTISLLKFWK